MSTALLERPLRTPIVRPLLSIVAGAPPEVQRVLRTHRKCAPEHASMVRAACLQDPSVLPRWHQDDRGPSNAHRGIRVSAPDGAYAGIAAWRSRDHWLARVVPIALGLHPEVLRRHSVSAHMFREFAKVKSGYAKHRNGRRCIVTPESLASVLGVLPRQIQRCNAVARELGLEVVVLQGRMLNMEEKMHCWKWGSRQRGLSTETALTVPRSLWRSVDSDTPGSTSSAPYKSNPSHYFPHGLAAEKKGSAPPTLTRRSAEPRRKARYLASQVTRTVPWLRQEALRRLAPVLMRFATAEVPWGAEDIAGAITSHTLRTGRRPIEPEHIRTHPAAVLASILRELDEVTDHPNPDPFFNADTATLAAAPLEPEACGSSGCDQGWLDQPDQRTAPCPDCPPAVRSGHVHAGEAEPFAFDPEDPPF